MAYPIYDIDITRPLPTISVADGDTGVAVLLRKHGRPLDFLIEALPSNRELKLKQLNKRIDELAKVTPSEESEKEDQGPPSEQFQFPSLTIAICTKDRPQYLARCLENLMNMMTRSNSIDSALEILVIDNAPSDNQNLNVVSSFSEVRYICEPLPGVSFARNRALKEARGQLLAYFDDDVVVDPGWLSRIGFLTLFLGWRKRSAEAVGWQFGPPAVSIMRGPAARRTFPIFVHALPTGYSPEIRQPGERWGG